MKEVLTPDVGKEGKKWNITNLLVIYRLSETSKLETAQHSVKGFSDGALSRPDHRDLDIKVQQYVTEPDPK